MAEVENCSYCGNEIYQHTHVNDWIDIDANDECPNRKSPQPHAPAETYQDYLANKADDERKEQKLGIRY